MSRNFNPPRRLQNFRLAPGEKITVRNITYDTGKEIETGTATVSATTNLTINSFAITETPGNRLVLIRAAHRSRNIPD